MLKISNNILKVFLLVSLFFFLWPLANSIAHAQSSCVATSSKPVSKNVDWELTVAFSEEPTNFVVHYEGTDIWTHEIRPGSNPFTIRQKAPNLDFTGVTLYTSGGIKRSLCAIAVPGQQQNNPTLTAKLESPSNSITSSIKILPSIVISGLHPCWQYRISTTGEWDGPGHLFRDNPGSNSCGNNDNDDVFTADSSGRIAILNLCDNGEANRTDCGDTFKNGTYSLLVTQLDGKPVGNFSFGVEAKTADGSAVIPGTNNAPPTKGDESVNTAFGNISTEPKQLVNTVLTIAIGIAGGIAFLLIVYGGFRLAFSQGDPKAVQEARDIITSAIVGLLLIIFSVFLLNLIGVDILGLPIGD